MTKNLISKFNIKILEDVNSRIYSFKKSIQTFLPNVKFLKRDKVFHNIINNYKSNSLIELFHLFESIANNIPSIPIYDKNTNIKHDSNFSKVMKNMLKFKLAFANVKEASEFNRLLARLCFLWNSKKKIKN